MRDLSPHSHRFAKHAHLRYFECMTFREVRTWSMRHPLMIIATIFFVGDVLIASILFARHHVLMVTFLDVGQGDAVFIQAPNGNQLLYDAGPPSGSVLRGLGAVMPFYDHSIDVAILSHPDMDHIGGFLDVLRRFDVDLVMEPGATSKNGVYEGVEAAIKTEGAIHLFAKKGMRIDMGDGVAIDILYPDRDTTTMETNSASIVMRLHYGGTSFLFSGDLPQTMEEYVVAQEGSGLHADVLKLGHHGSRTSSSLLWLAAVHPSIAVISAGLHNRYGHPHKEVLEALAEFGIPALKTYEEGTIIFESDGERVVRE